MPDKSFFIQASGSKFVHLNMDGVFKKIEKCWNFSQILDLFGATSQSFSIWSYFLLLRKWDQLSLTY